MGVSYFFINLLLLLPINTSITQILLLLLHKIMEDCKVDAKLDYNVIVGHLCSCHLFLHACNRWLFARGNR